MFIRVPLQNVRRQMVILIPTYYPNRKDINPGGKITVKMNAAPFPADLNTSAMITKRIPKNVDTTAASCGFVPKGAATKKDQLASVSPRRRWTMRMSPVLEADKMRKLHVRPTITHCWVMRPVSRLSVGRV